MTEADPALPRGDDGSTGRGATGVAGSYQRSGVGDSGWLDHAACCAQSDRGSGGGEYRPLEVSGCQALCRCVCSVGSDGSNGPGSLGSLIVCCVLWRRRNPLTPRWVGIKCLLRWRLEVHWRALGR